VKPPSKSAWALDFLSAEVAQASRLPGERSGNDPARTFLFARQAGRLRYVTSQLRHRTDHRIEIYRKLAQATDSRARRLADRIARSLRPAAAAGGMLLAVGELKILACEKSVTAIEVRKTN